MSTFRAGNYTFSLGRRTYIMGILNVTRDSFYDGGKWFDLDNAVAHAIDMQNSGADIIDIGAQSTRPGFTKIEPEEEIKRLIPLLESLKGKLTVPVSVDTFYPEVAEKALKCGVDIINDVTGFKNDKMIDVVSNCECGCIVMHDGKTNNMKEFFKDILGRMISKNISQDRICFDPGIGFGKDLEDNLGAIRDLKNNLLNNIAILVAASRKSLIDKICKGIPVEERLPGTIAINTIAICNGADIIRVHDVKEAVQAAKVSDAILR